MKKVGILGGTFDPVHNGHLALAKSAKLQYELDEIWFMPAKIPPHKLNNKVSDFSVRKKMIELAIEKISCFFCSDFENMLEGSSYTYKTLEILISMYPDTEFYFIMGADSFYEIETWKNPDIILSVAGLIIASRNYSDESLTLVNQYNHLKGKYDVKGIYFLDTKEIDISSRKIRELIKFGKNIQKYVPESVCRFIETKKLYV